MLFNVMLAVAIIVTPVVTLYLVTRLPDELDEQMR